MRFSERIDRDSIASPNFTPNEMSLQRFIDAQDGGASHDPSGTAYEVALKEIRNGAKIGHWIWFIFPQGPFGESARSQRYAINSSDEARAYLEHEVLRERLMQITKAVAERLEEGALPKVLMESSIDCQKLSSSMTLFHSVAVAIGDDYVSTITQRVLGQLEVHGWPPCIRTLEWLSNTQ